jgi:hypothetical protein
MSVKLAGAGGNARERLRVTFFLAGEQDLDRLRRLDPDLEPEEFVRGERSWILQTYVRLAAAGHDVELVGRPPEEGIVVFHAKQVELLMRYWRVLGRAVLVAVRADHNESHLADFQVLQNRVWVDGRTRFHVPHWPQPGLLPRDPGRGTRVERVAFKGFIGNLRENFRGAAWAGELRRRGIEWVADAVEFRRSSADDIRALRWSDYRDVDVVLAVRPADSRGHTDKPAAKLFNAWRAGVPALLGAEPAYRELRADPLDYVEVDTVAEALQAIDELRGNPELYAAMVAHGARRAAEFSIEAVVARWVDLLWRRIPELCTTRSWATLPYWLRPAARKAHRLLTRRPAR